MTPPRLSIGLPVYNGDDFLCEALDSILAQTFQDFELIISDNASTDRTEEICRSYARRDERIKYSRNPQNIGATQNWYRVFELSAGEFFASAAHDDVYAPDYMEKCISILDRDSAIVLCYSKTRIIDRDGKALQDGRIERSFEAPIDTMSDRPSVRLYNVLAVDYLCIQLYGVMRAETLRKTRVFAGYYACDRNTLAELALFGKLCEYPGYLFFHRIYPEALGGAIYSGRTLQELNELDPGTDWKSRSSALKVFSNYFGSIALAALPPAEKIKIYLGVLRVIFARLARRIRQVVRR